jgi:hypothetical protein
MKDELNQAVQSTAFILHATRSKRSSFITATD